MSAPDVLFVVGFVAFSVGLWMIAPPFALACGGALLMIFGCFAAMRGAPAAPTGENKPKGGNA